MENKIIKEDFLDFNTGELPYDKGHSALGEYHHLVYDGYFGNFYDPIALHQWRSLDGSWLITEEDGKHFLEQNRGDNSKGAFQTVYATLVHRTKLYSTYKLEYDLRMFEVAGMAGMAFSYLTSRYYYAVGLKYGSLCLYRRNEETIDIIDEVKLEPDFDYDKTYHFEVLVRDDVIVKLDGKEVLKGKIDYVNGRSIAFVSKSQVRYSNLLVTMTDSELLAHDRGILAEEKRIEAKRNKYPNLKRIKRLDLGVYGSGRQLRIAKYDGEVYLLFAQHQKRYIRDSFAHLSSMTLFNYTKGERVWTIGEPNNSFDNTMISCDLPFQIADVDNDGKLEVIYAMNFEVRIIDLLTKKLKRTMKTPIIYNDPLVKNEPFYRLNVDAIRVADFEGLDYKGDFIIKDRYQNVWAFDKDFKELFRYHNKNTGHFPYIFDYDNDGKDELLIGYDLIDHDGKMIWSLPMNTDHTDEIIYAKLHKNEEEKFILASGNEGMNLINKNGTIYKHNEIGHAQRISVAKYDLNRSGLQIMATAFWGSDGIVCDYDYKGNLINQMEVGSNGSVVTPVMYDGINTLCLLHSDTDGGLIDINLDRVVLFPDDGHPTLCSEVYDIDDDGIDEILCWDQTSLWVYKADKFTKPKKDYSKYPDTGFSNYRGEYLISLEDLS